MKNAEAAYEVKALISEGHLSQITVKEGDIRLCGQIGGCGFYGGRRVEGRERPDVRSEKVRIPTFPATGVKGYSILELIERHVAEVGLPKRFVLGFNPGECGPLISETFECLAR